MTNLRSNEKVDELLIALGLEPGTFCYRATVLKWLHSADEPSGKAYWETHEAPHCPTCSCGMSPKELTSQVIAEARRVLLSPSQKSHERHLAVADLVAAWDRYCFAPTETPEEEARNNEVQAVFDRARSALKSEANESNGCDMWIARGMTAEYGLVYMPSYGGTKSQVEQQVMDGARREGFRGTLKERLEQLSWEIVPGRFTVRTTGNPND